MSVLLVHLGSAFSDDGEQTLLLARALREAGREALLACPEESPLAVAANDADLPLVELENTGPGLSLWWTLNRLVRERGIRLLHTLDERAFLTGALLRRRRRDLCFVHTVFTAPARARTLRGWAAKQVDALVCAGTDLAESLRPDHGTAAKLRVILPAVRAAAPTANQGFLGGRPAGRFIFVASGELGPAADHASLVQAMAYLQTMAIDDLPDWEVRVLGEGSLFGTLLDSAEKLGVRDRLSLIGGQRRRVFLPSADAVVCCDAAGRGGVPVVLEAWTCGTPVACTALPAHRDLGEDKVSVLFSPPSNPVALAGSMLRLMQEPALRERLSAGGRAALERFRPARLGAEYAALYDEVRNRAPEAAPSSPPAPAS